MAALPKILLIADAMRTTLEQHSWDTIVPEAVEVGMIPPGWLAFPVVSVMPTDMRAGREFAGRSVSEDTYEIVWELAESLDPANLAQQWAQHIEWRHEAISLCRKAIDGTWGVPGVSLSLLSAAEMNLAERETTTTTVSLVLSTAITMEVTYREQVQ